MLRGIGTSKGIGIGHALVLKMWSVRSGSMRLRIQKRR